MQGSPECLNLIYVQNADPSKHGKDGLNCTPEMSWKQTKICGLAEGQTREWLRLAQPG